MKSEEPVALLGIDPFMKIDVACPPAFSVATPPRPFAVSGESGRLTDVILCAPTHLAPVPCCSKTRESMRSGFTLSNDLAQDQHRRLRDVLIQIGVRCHQMPPAEAMPDLCFTRDTSVSTPWGVVLLNPALPHRVREADHVADALARMGAAPVRRISEGTIEGGDVCIARPGLLIVGVSGERTTTEGADAFAAPFVQAGWDVVACPLDPFFLHLDTVFCMLDRSTALACVDVLDDGFLTALAARGIRLIPASYKEARDLACNILSVDGTTILTSADHPRIASALREHGFAPIEVAISQFAACGGGLHCLTMPLARSD